MAGDPRNEFLTDVNIYADCSAPNPFHSDVLANLLNTVMIIPGDLFQGRVRLKGAAHGDLQTI